MNFLSFIKENKTFLRFGLLLTLFSSFGQTFLIALYVPSLLNKFGFTNGEFGGLYGLATLASAFSLTFIGKLIDRYPLERFTMANAFFMAASLSITALSPNVVILFIGIWGLRLSGQGLMSHIAITSISRYFDRTRGKALSIITLGQPLGEAMFPLLITLMIYGWGWQETLFISAALVLIVFIPTVRGSSVFQKYRHKNESTASLDIAWTQRQVLKSKAFYMIAPSIFMLSMIGTVLFFYQVSIARFKGWSPEWLAACFIGYAIASSSFMLLAGSWIDRFTARRLFPYYMAPLALGILLMIYFDHPWVAPIYMILLGISVGFGSTIKSAVQAEIFGITSLGAVRSLFSTISVVSTAAGPALFGLLLDHGFTFHELLWLSLTLVVLVMIQSFRVLPAFTRKRIYVRLRR